eukprot:2482173-Lingulodinium_polyedra.AAC.1
MKKVSKARAMFTADLKDSHGAAEIQGAIRQLVPRRLQAEAKSVASECGKLDLFGITPGQLHLTSPG